MDGWREMNRADLEILDSINREWQAERLRAARAAHRLRGPQAPMARPGRAHLLMLVLSAGLMAVLAAGLAAAAAGPGI